MPTRQKVLVSVALVAMLLVAVAVLVFVPPSPDAVANDGWKGAMIGGLIGGIVGPLLLRRQKRLQAEPARIDRRS